MVYCNHCGTKNKDESNFCVKCGANIAASAEKSIEKGIEEAAEEFGRRAEGWGKDFGKNVENECFGLPHGGTIFGIIIGIMIILVGVTSIVGLDFHLWPFILLAFGLLVFCGALYSILRKR